MPTQRDPLLSECGLPKAQCHREHFCARCGGELNKQRRVPVPDGFVHPRCVNRRKQSR